MRIVTAMPAEFHADNWCITEYAGQYPTQDMILRDIRACHPRIRWTPKHPRLSPVRPGCRLPVRVASGMMALAYFNSSVTQVNMTDAGAICQFSDGIWHPLRQCEFKMPQRTVITRMTTGAF